MPEKQTIVEPEVASPLSPKRMFSWKRVLIGLVIALFLISFGAVFATAMLYPTILGVLNRSEEQTSTTTKTATKSAAATSSATKDETTDWKEYTSPEGYKVKYPPNWLTTNEKSGASCSTDVVFFAPTKELLGLCGSGFGGIINASIIPEGTLEGSHNEADYQDFKREDTLVDGKQAVKITGIWQWSNETYDYRGYKVIEYRTKLKDKILVFSYLRSPNWTDYSKEFEQIVSTFKFL